MRGFRKPARNIVDEKRSLDTFRHPRWTRDPVAGDIVPAVVMALDGGAIRVRVGRLTGIIGRTGYAWTRRTAEDLVRAGDVIEVRVGKARTDGVFDADLEQPPTLEGAVVAIDNHTGRSSGDDWRRQLRALAVQPRRPGEAAGWLALQAVRLPGGDRQRLHRGLDAVGRPDVVRCRRRPAAVRTQELRPRIQGRPDPSPRARAFTQRAGRRPDGEARTAERASLSEAARHHDSPPGVPVGRHRRGRGHVARNDVCVLCVSQSGRAA